jgi:hypothetical protein
MRPASTADPDLTNPCPRVIPTDRMNLRKFIARAGALRISCAGAHGRESRPHCAGIIIKPKKKNLKISTSLPRNGSWTARSKEEGRPVRQATALAHFARALLCVPYLSRALATLATVRSESVWEDGKGTQASGRHLKPNHRRL